MNRFVVLILLAAANAHAAEAEALAISANIQARHLPFGTVLDPFYASPTSDQITGYTRCGDSALWTGHYLAAEAYRYRVTASPDALANAARAAAAIQGLIDVTGSGLLARCRIAMGSPFAAGIHSEEAANGVFTNTAAGYTWIGNTSRDQYCGVVYGLGVAHELIPQLRPAVAATVTRLVQFLLNNDWTNPNFLLRPDQQLAILQIGAQVNPTQFRSLYETQRARLAGAVSVPVAFDSLSTSSYFKFNLIYITFYSLIHHDDSIPYERAYMIARRYTDGHQNAFFNMIDAALFGHDERRDTETLALLDLWLKRPRRDFFVDLRTKVPVCGDQACDPIPVDQRTPTDFLWQRNPFQLSGGGNGTIGNAGVDYILPYWMARYYGLLNEFNIGPIAADSIASLYGTNQPSNPRLRITGADGFEQSATLLYASPNQVNFLVPAGLPNGIAALALISPDGSQKTASVPVQTTAPSLFTMNGRVAAATAVRVENGGQTAVPVFTCLSVQCIALPIELNSAAPVYLTLYGTGLRRRQTAIVTVKRANVPVLYAGVQPSFPGLDQVNIELPASLRGSGEVEIVLSVDGHVSNTVTVNIR